MKESPTRELLGIFPCVGEACGRDGDYGATTEASAPLPDRVPGGKEGTGGLGFVLGLGGGLIHLGGSPDGRHGGHGGVDVRHAQVFASCTEEVGEGPGGLGLRYCSTRLLVHNVHLAHFLFSSFLFY